MGVLTDLQRSGADVVVLGLDSEPFEDADAVVKHVEDNNLEGTYAVTTQELISALQNEFGPEVITPPTSPVVLLSADQSAARLLPRGLKDQGQLEAALEEGP